MVWDVRNNFGQGIRPFLLECIAFNTAGLCCEGCELLSVCEEEAKVIHEFAADLIGEPDENLEDEHSEDQQSGKAASKATV